MTMSKNLDFFLTLAMQDELTDGRGDDEKQTDRQDDIKPEQQR